MLTLLTKSVEKLHFYQLQHYVSLVNFEMICCDNVVRMYWSVLGTKTTWVGWGKIMFFFWKDLCCSPHTWMNMFWLLFKNIRFCPHKHGWTLSEERYRCWNAVSNGGHQLDSLLIYITSTSQNDSQVIMMTSFVWMSIWQPTTHSNVSLVLFVFQTPKSKVN